MLVTVGHMDKNVHAYLSQSGRNIKEMKLLVVLGGRDYECSPCLFFTLSIMLLNSLEDKKGKEV